MSACSAKTEAPARAVPEVKLASCGANELPRVDGTCVAVGASAPPSAPVCGEGTLAVPGDAACRPIGQCESAKWKLGTFTDHRYVDIAADPTTADGTEAHPFPTIQRAIDAAPAGAAVVVTDGRYIEDLVVKKPTTILGRCATKVTIVGRGSFAVDVSSDLDLRDVGVTGTRVGIGIASGRTTLTNVWVYDTGDRGIDVEDFAGEASLTLRGSLVERTRDIGVFASGAVLTIEQSVVRGTRSLLGSAGKPGQGVQARAGETTGAPSTLTLRKSVVEDNIVYGVLVVDSRANVEDSIVRKTAGTAASPAAGLTTHKQLGKQRSAVRVVRSLFEGHEGVGLDLADALATVEDVTIRAVRGSESTGALFERSEVEARGLTVEEIVGNGITVKGATVSLSSLRLRDLTSTASDRNGAGIVVDVGDEGPSRATLAEVLIERAQIAGLIVFGSVVEARDLAVFGTRANALGTLGDGIAVISRAYEGGTYDVGALTLDRAFLRDNARAGLVLFGATARISNTVLCNGINLDVERVVAEADGVPIEHAFSLEDGGGNACGCASPSACVAQTTGLKPVAR